MGVIYILTNPSFPEYVKIGYADDLEKRLKQLNQSECMPFAFRVYAKYEVEKRLKDLDLHALIDKLNPELRSIDEFDGKPRIREFYAMTPEDAYEILECIAKISGTEDKLYRMKPEGHEILDEELAGEINDNLRINNEISQNKKDRLEYWTALHEYVKKYNKVNLHKEFTKIRNPHTDHWLTFSIGSKDYNYNVLRLKNKNLIELEVYFTDKELYDKVFSYKDKIEEETNLKFIWDDPSCELKNKRAKTQSEQVDLMNQDDWESQFEWTLDTLLYIKKVFTKYIKM